MSTRTRAIVRSSVGLAVLFFAGAAFGQDEAAQLDTGDTAWMMTSTALVLMMTLPGLALFYGGLVRSKNILSILMQCLISAGMAGLLWVIAGYSLAFGEGNAFIGDLSKGILMLKTPNPQPGEACRNVLNQALRKAHRNSPGG